MEVLNAAGMLPTRNFREGVFEGIERIGWAAYERDILVGRGTCYGCAIKCKREIEVKEGRYAVPRTYGGPEYETLQGFGGYCGVDDLQAIAKANDVCNRHVRRHHLDRVDDRVRDGVLRGGLIGPRTPAGSSCASATPTRCSR